MNVNCTKSTPLEIKKKLFTLKPVQKDGLILQIHHTAEQYSISKKKNIPYRIRFLYTSFDKTGRVIASADIDGNVFLIDLAQEKYWLLPKFPSCTALKFSTWHSSDLVIATNDGKVFIVNIHKGYVNAVWEEHQYPVRDISFARDLCLTASSQEAVIFNLVTYKKLHALTLSNRTSLKKVIFMPISHYILACFNDFFINVWNSKNFESVKQILPTTWKKRSIKSIAFSRDGRLMILAGNSIFLIIFSLDTWSLKDAVPLEIESSAIRQIDFIPQDADGGNNKILAVLATDGIFYIYDMHNNEIVNKLQHEAEMMSFDVTSNGYHIACVMHSGEVNVYRTSNLIKKEIDKEETKVQQKLKIYLPTQKQVSDGLDLDKLKSILLEFGEYPTAYRNLIWSKILMLPINRDCYASFINRSEHFFPNIEKDFPLINKASLRNLKRVLNNLAHWCPFFGKVTFLPLFIFPFLKIFENDPCACFEAVATIITNWCQHWLEYYPIPPVNILAVIENILLHHEESLMLHLVHYKITSHIYAWSILETAFTEVLTIKEWTILWDHIISNEPSFLLLAVIAYTIINRNILLTFTKRDDFINFYHSQTPFSFKKFISKIYSLNKNTPCNIHPRQYLNNFTPLTKNAYPVFLDYPHVGDNSTTENIIKCSVEDVTEEEIIEEERKRHQHLKEIYKTQKIEEQSIAPEIKTKIQKKIYLDEVTLGNRNKELKNILDQVTSPQAMGDQDFKDLDKKIDDYVCDLLEQKMKLQEIMLRPRLKKDKFTVLRNEQDFPKNVEAQKNIRKILKQMKPEKNKSKFKKLEESTREIENQVYGLLSKWNKPKDSKNKPSNKETSATKTKETKKTKKRIKPVCKP